MIGAIVGNGVLLCISAIMDYTSGKIPNALTIAWIIFNTLYSFLSGNYLNIVIAIPVFIFLTWLTMKKKIGGADAKIVTSLIVLSPIIALASVFFSFLMGLEVKLIFGNESKIRYIPYLFVGFIVSTILLHTVMFK